MDKKAKKKIDVLRQKIKGFQLRLSGAKQQNDEPGEIEELEKLIEAAKAEIEKLKAS